MFFSVNPACSWLLASHLTKFVQKASYLDEIFKNINPQGYKLPTTFSKSFNVMSAIHNC